MSQSPILEMRNISKTFGAVRALKDVSLSVLPGELHALMGENGAGKSTLMKILSGAYTADPGGTVIIEGHSRTEAAGSVAVIYQELSLAPNLTVAENMFLGREIANRGILNRSATLERAQPILDRLGVHFDARSKVGDLSLGERQMVEIARALTTDARLIVMDEPTTSLSARETERLFEVIARLKSHGIAIIYISHRMEEVYALADRCSVLRDGVYIGTLDRSELSAQKLVSMMVGRDLDSFYKKGHIASPDHTGTPLLSVRDMSDGGLVKGCSFDLYRGEVLGIAGLVGSGRTELARLIYGADPRTSGTVAIDGRDIDTSSPRAALDAGVAYLTEDRKKLGLFLDMSISDNVNVGVIERDAKSGGRLDFRAAARRANDAIKALAVKAPTARMPVGGLSGGNQQKVLIARLLETGPKVVILDEPTRGVDVGAKSEIYKLIDGLARKGVGVVMISSELAEIIGVADRVLVMREGHIAGQVPAQLGQAISQEAIMELSTGSVSEPATATEGAMQ
ncbi:MULTISPECIES: sugar ABC transporter ATP-binding protein [Paracoccus]|uniref:ATP-binding cassette domain-containing protein n=1 Tax=Paracoccus litorisediminis TaxID=2006130 RepID=A0A844HR22_9RHOB|nr:MULTISPECIES: sugar ABC transporter ATP-binding protein [Paracoccus]MBD9528603.1 sugar ABC transporter ATP-binding protein [Paracoccus sp. PAR01]MTH60605.1 ATP-binding cassette domain-containing protein [Paracoccus litorisediminis]